MQIPVLALIGLGTWYLTRKKEKLTTDAKQLKMMPVGIEFKSIKDIKLVMQILNPSTSTFKLDALSANIYYKDSLIGTVYRNQPFTIAATNDSLIKFDVALKSTAIVAVLNLLADRKDKYKKINVMGSYMYYGFNFPFQETINVNYATKK